MSELQSAIDEIKAAGTSAPRKGRDPVNQPMIHHWVDAIGDRNPIYVDDEAARAVGHPGVLPHRRRTRGWPLAGSAGAGPAADRRPRRCGWSAAAGLAGGAA